MQLKTAVLSSCFVLFANLAHGQDLSQKVSLTTAGEPAWKAVAELGKAAGIPMEAPLPLGADTVVIKVKDAVLKDVMDRLARATTGRWETSNDKLILVRDDLTAASEKKAELATLSEAFRKGIQRQAEVFLKTPTFDAVAAENLLKEIADLSKNLQNLNDPAAEKLFAKQQELQSASPIGRAMAQCLLSLDPGQLAQLPPNLRIVFATDPTLMQRPLGDGAYKALQSFGNDYATWTSIAKRMPPDENGYFTFGAELGSDPLKFRPAKLLLTVYKWDGSTGLNADLTVVDEKGGYISQLSSSITPEPAPIEPPKGDPNKTEQPITISDDAKLLGSLARGVGYSAVNSQGIQALPAALQEKLLNPEQSDPMSIAVGPLVIAVADGAQKQLIAVLPDEAFTVANFASGNTPSAIRRVFEDQGSLRFEETDGWMIARPQRPNESRETQMNRATLGTFIRKIAQSGRPSLDELAAYALKNPHLDSQSLGLYYIMLLFPDALSGANFNDWDVLRFYGVLSPDQKQSLLSGQGLNLGTIGQEAQRRLTTLVFYKTAMGISLDMQNQDLDYAFGNIASEPTQVLPNGLPGSGILKMTKTSEQAVMATGGGPYQEAMNAQELGNQLAIRERPDLYPWVNELPDFGRYRFGDRIQYDITVQLTTALSQSYQLRDIKGSGGKPVALNELPDAFRKDMEKARDEMRDAQKNMKPGDVAGPPGQHNPPPAS